MQGAALGEAQRQVGNADFRETLLQASDLACEVGDAALAARAAIANNRGITSAFGEVDTDRLAALERALEMGRFTSTALSARLISLQAVELTYDFDHERRRALAEEALALAREVGDPSTLAPVISDYIFAVMAPGWRLMTFRALEFDQTAAFSPNLLKQSSKYREWLTIVGTEWNLYIATHELSLSTAAERTAVVRELAREYRPEFTALAVPQEPSLRTLLLAQAMRTNKDA